MRTHVNARGGSIFPASRNGTGRDVMSANLRDAIGADAEAGAVIPTAPPLTFLHAADDGPSREAFPPVSRQATQAGKMRPRAVAIISMAMAASTMPMRRLEMLSAVGESSLASTGAAAMQALKKMT